MTDPYRIRSPETWARAREDYLAGMDAEAVCSRHDLGLSAFRRRARREGWRRVDQDDPAPVDLDLSIYDDVESDEQVELARLRFVRALHHARSAEAARWRRLWLEMRAEDDALDADIFPGMSRGEVRAFLAAERAQRDAEEEREALAAIERRPALARPGKVHNVHSTGPNGPSGATPERPSRLAFSGNVHDVHSIFSGGDSAGLSPPAAGP